MHARAEYEYVGHKFLDAGNPEHPEQYEAIPVGETRIAMVRPFLDGRLELGVDGLIARGYTGQTTETFDPNWSVATSATNLPYCVPGSGPSGSPNDFDCGAGYCITERDSRPAERDCKDSSVTSPSAGRNRVLATPIASNASHRSGWPRGSAHIWLARFMTRWSLVCILARLRAKIRSVSRRTDPAPQRGSLYAIYCTVRRNGDF